MMSSHPPPQPPDTAHVSGGSRRGWLIGGACACVLALLLAAVVGGGGFWYVAMRETPEAVVEEYLAAWDAADCETHEELSTERFRGEGYTCEGWTEMLESQSQISFEGEIGETTIDGDRAAVRYTELATDDTGTYRSVYDFILVRQDGSWLLDSTEPVQEPERV